MARRNQPGLAKRRGNADTRHADGRGELYHNDTTGTTSNRLEVAQARKAPGKEPMRIRFRKPAHPVLLGLVPALALVPFGFMVVGTTEQPPIQRLVVQVIQEYPHDSAAYTQGLVWDNGRMFESTGLYGESTLREVDYTDGEVLRSVSLPSNQFGEGLALVGDNLIQLTWREGVAHVYNRDSFLEVNAFPYGGEGWGLCYDGARLAMSNGSSKLFFRSATSFDVATSLTVTRDGTPVERLNELEYAEGFIYANVYMTREIVKIDPSTGRIVASIDASALDPGGTLRYGDVLNGIAFDPVGKVFFLTGKRWPKLYKAVFVPETARMKDEL